MKISEALKKELKNSATARLDLDLLLEEVLQKPRSFLFANPERALTEEQQELFSILYERRLRGEPVAYILGKKEFWSREFIVNSKVLIPRPETELLIEIILQNFNEDPISIADLGTGSGAIALTLACERSGWNVVATDISEDALQIASHNAMRLQVQNIEFYCDKWCDALPDRKFDVIVSNPPYIKKGYVSLLRDCGDAATEKSPSLRAAKQRGNLLESNDSSIKHTVKRNEIAASVASVPSSQRRESRFEPTLALESGEDGLDAIREIILQAKEKLKPGGMLILEHGYDQRELIQNLLQQHNYQEITTYRDLAGIDRAISVRFW